MASGDDDFQFGQEASREHYYFRGGDSRNKLFCDGSQTNQNQL
jgi:CDGSH-type Zn-finger protein